MHASMTTSPDLLRSWNASYLAAAKSPILSALRLAASDIDALARQVADRCVTKAAKRRSHGAGGRRSARSAR